MHKFKHAVRPEQLTDPRRSREHIPHVRAVALQRVKHAADLLDCIRREHIFDDQKAVASELLTLPEIKTHHRG